MNTNAKYGIGIVVLIIVVAGAYALTRQGTAPSPTASSTETGAMQGADTGPEAEGTPVNGVPVASGESGQPQASRTVTVTYTDQGFSPKEVTLNKGDSITFVNKSANPMWVASGVHPVHTEYDGTTREVHCAAGYTGPAPFDECATGTSFTFTFDKIGTWDYHNHADAEMTGTVIVK
jgi:plastocyanin